LPLVVSGVTTSDVAAVRLLFADTGGPVLLEPVAFPAETGLDWKVFAFVPEAAAGSLVAAVALDTAGTELSRYVPPRRAETAPYVVQPLSPIVFAGTGNATGGVFELPPPAFPATIALEVQHEAQMSLVVVCDTGRNVVLDPAGNAPPTITVAGGSTYHVTLSPGATACSFEVESAGAWEIRSP
jgi:hypothetical protein